MDAHPKCDVCGKPASSVATDVERVPTINAGWYSRPIGKTKYGCDEHPAQSVREDNLAVLCDNNGNPI